MPPARWLNRPACAKPYAIAIEPSAVTIQESSEMAPTLAMFVGSMMMPEPIMFTATMNVSWIRLIFFFSAIVSSSSLAAPRHVRGRRRCGTGCVLPPFLEHSLDLVVEAREAVERLLEGDPDLSGPDGRGFAPSWPYSFVQ